MLENIVLRHDPSLDDIWHFGMGPSKSYCAKKNCPLAKRAIRTINKAAYDSHTEPLHKRSSILKITDQYDYEVAMFMRDYMKNKWPVSFQNTYQYNYESQESHQTRSSNQLNIKSCESKFAKSLPLHSFPEAWNRWGKRAPATSVGSRALFKKHIQNYIFSSYAENITCTNVHCLDCHTK